MYLQEQLVVAGDLEIRGNGRSWDPLDSGGVHRPAERDDNAEHRSNELR